MSERPPEVGLFVTCLVDFFRPTVGLATVKLLEKAGCRVTVPAAQSCCGQPAYNQGDRREAIAIATQVIEAFADFDYVVLPSGSCAGMLSKHYPALFDHDPILQRRAENLARRTFELTTFLNDVLKVQHIDTVYESRTTYHDSCSGLRELGIRAQPRALLAQIDGLQLTELQDPEPCCGFGGTFCVKYPEVSTQMVRNKAQQVADTGAEMVLGGDLGCLINLAGQLHRSGSETEVRHVAEVLAGMTDGPAIGRE